MTWLIIRLLYYIMERMKVEIDNEELKRLKSREEKYLAYMDMLSYRWEDETYVDALCWKVAELEEEKKSWKRSLLLEWKMIQDIDEWNNLVEERNDLLEENKNLKEENEALKEWVAKWMSYKNTYNDAIPRDENWFYKEVEPTC